MKKNEAHKARAMRKKGKSLGEIAKQLGVSKGSASLWVRDIILTEKQKKCLTQKGHSVGVVEKRREARLRNEEEKRKIIIQGAKKGVGNINKEALFFIGISLYWGEGSKTKRGSVEFSNSDTRLVKIMKLFFDIICIVPETKYRGHVYLHPHLNSARAEKYWSNISGIPLKQFHKTTQQHNKASLNKKDTLPYGTFTIGIYDTELFLKIMGWMEGVYDKLITKK